MSNYTFATDEATGIGMQTLVGSYGEFPRTGGNCFSVSVKGYDKDQHVMNMYVENLEELIKRGVVSFPIKVWVQIDGQCVIHDERIEDDWYRTKFCTICTPNDLLPLPQRLAYARKIERGDIEIVESNGMTIIKQQVNAESRKLDTKWTCETSMDEGYFYAPFVPEIPEIPEIPEDEINFK